jgi:SAM-dependent methyltransferase
VNSLDATYRELRERGLAGWGGRKFRSRLKGWGRELNAWHKNGLLPPAPAVMLELGCGNGAISTLMARRGYVVTGIDISELAISWAREEFERRCLRGEFRVCDVTEGLMPFSDRTFDAVIDGNCLHCVCDADARARSLDAVHRVLRPGGTLVVSSMCGEPRSLEGPDSFDRERCLLMRDGAPYRFLPRADALIAEITRAGFEPVTARVQTNPWWDHLWLVARRS